MSSLVLSVNNSCMSIAILHNMNNFEVWSLSIHNSAIDVLTVIFVSANMELTLTL